MTKQEIVNKLATKRNFHKYVEVCLHEGLSIEKLKYAPNINIYYDDSDYLEEYRDLSCNCDLIDLRDVIQFEVDGELLTGTENFFRYYSKITKFIVSNITYYVKPHTLTEHWYRNTKDDVDGHFEISYDCHSFHKPAITEKYIGASYERYYINGKRIDHETFIKESREHKLSRIMGIDIKSERLKKEIFENNLYIVG
jgi:hypothetical protein